MFLLLIIWRPGLESVKKKTSLWLKIVLDSDAMFFGRVYTAKKNVWSASQWFFTQSLARSLKISRGERMQLLKIVYKSKMNTKQTKKWLMGAKSVKEQNIVGFSVAQRVHKNMGLPFMPQKKCNPRIFMSPIMRPFDANEAFWTNIAFWGQWGFSESNEAFSSEGEQWDLLSLMRPFDANEDFSCLMRI